MEMANTILLRCPKCNREMQVARDYTDYPEAVRVEVTCDRCDDGDFSELMHFDADGNHITRDPDIAATPAAVQTFTTGHCVYRKYPTGCPFHNLQCGWPSCDRQPTPAASGEEGV
jgi:hypothetical protein